MFYICTNFKKLGRYKLIFIKPIYLLVGLLVNVSVFGQRYELGIRGGFSNLVGDIGNTSYIQPPLLSGNQDVGVYLGVIYRMNFNPHQTLRFDLGYNQIVFNDANAKEAYRKKRGYNKSENTAIDIDAIFEYNLFPVNDKQKGMLSPYIFGGIGASFYAVKQVTFTDTSANTDVLPTLYDNVQQKYNATEKFKNKAILNIPFGVGLKYKFNYNWAISAEAMFRPMFSDAIDYSMINDKDVRILYNKENVTYKDKATRKPYVEEAKNQVKDFLDQRNIGNKHSNDWVNSITLSLTYSFGRPPCYCD